MSKMFVLQSFGLSSLDSSFMGALIHGNVHEKLFPYFFHY